MWWIGFISLRSNAHSLGILMYLVYDYGTIANAMVWPSFCCWQFNAAEIGLFYTSRLFIHMENQRIPLYLPLKLMLRWISIMTEVQKNFLNGDGGFDCKDANKEAPHSGSFSTKIQVSAPKFKYLFALATDMGGRDILRFAKYKFLSYDKYAQGTVLWKVGAHLSMCGWLLSFPAYHFGVRSAGQKAEEKVKNLDSMVKPRLQQFSVRIRDMESSLNDEKLKRKRLSKKTAAKFKQLNGRVSVLEVENLAKVNNDKKDAAFSVRVTGALLEQLARDNKG